MTRVVSFVLAAGLHALVILSFIAFWPPPQAPAAIAKTAARASDRADVRHIVFIAREPIATGGGGGGGGNRQTGPIRHATAPGSDAFTLRIAKSVATTGRPADTPTLPAILLDAKPLASGIVDQVGLPTGGVSYGTSTGPGSGGGVGEGVGTGIGPGRGPGLGPGSGGGTGGGTYRAGGAVSAPRVISEVRPTYTDDALAARIQGTVVLELIVRANGRPSDIRIVRSLDPAGLDRQAIIAASQWRFEPGRLGNEPVDVLVNIMLQFSIR